MILLFAPLLAAVAAPPPVAPDAEHRVAVEHRAGPFDVRYRGALDVAHRQVGAVVPGGRPSTLRCQWDASLMVERDARHASGATLARSWRTAPIASGSRAGWCEAQRAPMAADARRAAGDLDAHIAALAAADRAELHAEADRLSAATAG